MSPLAATGSFLSTTTEFCSCRPFNSRSRSSSPTSTSSSSYSRPLYSGSSILGKVSKVTL